MSYIPRLKEFYKKEVTPKLMEQFKYSSVMQVPKIEKICINQGIGGSTQDKKLIEVSLNEISQVTGQKAVRCICLLYTSPSPRDRQKSRMPSSA